MASVPTLTNSPPTAKRFTGYTKRHKRVRDFWDPLHQGVTYARHEPCRDCKVDVNRLRMRQ